MCWVLCPLFPFIYWSPQNVMVSGNRVFKEVKTVSPLGWALIQYDWCPCKKGELGHTTRHCAERMYREALWRLSKSWPSVSLEDRPPEKPACQHLGLGLQSRETIQFSCLSLLFYGSPSALVQRQWVQRLSPLPQPNLCGTFRKFTGMHLMTKSYAD